MQAVRSKVYLPSKCDAFLTLITLTNIWYDLRASELVRKEGREKRLNAPKQCNEDK